MNRQKLFLTFSGLCALLAVAFTFVTLGYFHDVNGWTLGLELPVGTQRGPLSTAADLFFTASPLIAAIAVLWCFFRPTARKLPTVLFFLPSFLYALLKFFAIAEESKKQDPFFLMTLVAILLTSALALGSLWTRVLCRGAAGLFFLHAGLETLLLLVSLIAREKLSQFYLGGYLNFQNGYYYFQVVLSVFFYHVFFATAAALFLLGHAEEKKTAPDEAGAELSAPLSEKVSSIPASDEDDDNDDPPLTLADLGIDR